VPTISAGDQPKIRSAAGFHRRIRVSGPNSTSASGDESMTARSLSSGKSAPQVSMARV
jgi:hypothetical protein